MPWTTVPGSRVDDCRDDQVAVVKEDEDGEPMLSEHEGCHDSAEDAQEQISALEASEDEDEEERSVPTKYEEAYTQGGVIERPFSGVVDRDATGDDQPVVMRFAKGDTTDAHRTRFDMDGAVLDRYKKNPIVRWAHGQDRHGRVPIGRAEVAVNGDDLVAQVRFDQEDEFAQKIESKVRRGFVNAGSIHAKPLAQPEMRSVDGEQIVAFPEWELRGLSVVDIPSNPDTLALSRDNETSTLEQRLERLERMLVGGADMEERSVSVDAVKSALREAVFDMDGPNESWFIRDVELDAVDGGSTSGSVIAHERESGQTFRMGFDFNGQEVTLSDRDEWTEVTQTWEPVEEMDRMIEEKRALGYDVEIHKPLTRDEAIQAAASAVAEYVVRRKKKVRKQKKRLRKTTKQVLGKA